MLRAKAMDVPSALSAHYAGTAPGPVPFAFDLEEDFEKFSAHMLFVDPKYCLARTQVPKKQKETSFPPHRLSRGCLHSRSNFLSSSRSNFLSRALASA